MSGPLLDLKAARRIWIGKTEAQKLWIGGAAWTKPAAPATPESRLYLNSAPAQISGFALSSAAPQSVVLRGATGSRRWVTWLVDVVPGCVITFAYSGSGRIWVRTTNLNDGSTWVQSLLSDVVVPASPVTFTATLSAAASRFSILNGSGAPAADISISNFRIYVP